MVGTAQMRLCPSYDSRNTIHVIASDSEAIHRAANEGWIASLLTLLAMTIKKTAGIAPGRFCFADASPLPWRCDPRRRGRQ
jgi:hypothetical protein